MSDICFLCTRIENFEIKFQNLYDVRICNVCFLGHPARELIQRIRDKKASLTAR